VSSPDRLHLAELLDFRPDQGVIRLHEQRVVILSAAAMGLLRKELVDTFGLETARRLLLRFGFADGYHDAVTLRERSNWSSPIEGLRAGAMLHTLEGIVRADVRRIAYDSDSGRFEQEVTWRESYEAEQHLHHYGPSPSPVCWSLIGYSSGFASACMGKEIYFREESCLGEGKGVCVAIGRDAESWGDVIDEVRADFQAANLGQEVERLRGAVRKRLAELDRREQLLERRERELNLLRERVKRHDRIIDVNVYHSNFVASAWVGTARRGVSGTSTHAQHTRAVPGRWEAVHAADRAEPDDPRGALHAPEPGARADAIRLLDRPEAKQTLGDVVEMGSRTADR